MPYAIRPDGLVAILVFIDSILPMLFWSWFSISQRYLLFLELLEIPRITLQARSVFAESLPFTLLLLLINLVVFLDRYG